MMRLLSLALSFFAAIVAQPDCTAQAQSTTLVEARVLHHGVSNGYAPWKEISFHATYSFAEKSMVHCGVLYAERFSLIDYEIVGGISFQLDDVWTANIAGTASPRRVVLPHWSAAGEITRIIGNGWNAAAGIRQTRYAMGHSTRGTLGVEYYWGNYRGAYLFLLSHASGATASSAHRVRLDYYYNDRSAIGLMASQGVEIERYDGLRFTETSALALTLIGKHWLNSSLGVTYELLWHRHGDQYVRMGGGVGFCVSF